jgi:hypothetical protein
MGSFAPELLFPDAVANFRSSTRFGHQRIWAIPRLKRAPRSPAWTKFARPVGDTQIIRELVIRKFPDDIVKMSDAGRWTTSGRLCAKSYQRRIG